VLKPGFLALLEDPFDSKLLDIILFDVLPSSDGNGEGRVVLAKETKERNPLHSGFQVILPINVCVRACIVSEMNAE
jgi:phospholipase D1/2